jgi:hypothetical protein
LDYKIINEYFTIFDWLKKSKNFIKTIAKSKGAMYNLSIKKVEVVR